MVVLSMKYKEVYDHFASDKKKVDIRTQYLLPKAIKVFKQTKVFPAWVWYDYTIPSTNNRYVIFFYSANFKCITQPKSDFFCVLYDDNQRYIVKWGASTYKSKEGKLEARRTLNFYTSHFLQRYNDRCIKNNTLSSNDVMCRFLSRNEVVAPIQIDEEVNKNWKEYGEFNGIGFRVNDGICFGSSFVEYEPNSKGTNDDIKAHVNYYRTYVSKNEMSQEQWDVISKRYIKMWKTTMADYVAQSVNGEISLRLEP